jgi:hypothetical protein
MRHASSDQGWCGGFVGAVMWGRRSAADSAGITCAALGQPRLLAHRQPPPEPAPPCCSAPAGLEPRVCSCRAGAMPARHQAGVRAACFAGGRMRPDCATHARPTQAAGRRARDIAPHPAAHCARSSRTSRAAHLSNEADHGLPVACDRVLTACCAVLIRAGDCAALAGTGAGGGASLMSTPSLASR